MSFGKQAKHERTVWRMVAIVKAHLAAGETKTELEKDGDPSNSDCNVSPEKKFKNCFNTAENDDSATAGEHSSIEIITEQVKSDGNGHIQHVILRGIGKKESILVTHWRLNFETHDTHQSNQEAFRNERIAEADLYPCRVYCVRSPDET